MTEDTCSCITHRYWGSYRH